MVTKKYYKHMRKNTGDFMRLRNLILSLFLILCISSPVLAADMDGKTDYSMLYLIAAVALIFLGISLYTLYNVGANFISLVTMFFSSLAFMDIANTLVNGSLVTILQDGTEIAIRNTSASRLMQWIGLTLMGVTIIQAVFLKNKRIFTKKEFGEVDDEFE